MPDSHSLSMRAALSLTDEELEDLKAMVSAYQPKAHTAQFAKRPALSEEQRAPYVRRCALRDRILGLTTEAGHA